MKKLSKALPLIMISVLMVFAAGMMSAAYADDAGIYRGIHWIYTSANQTLEFVGAGEIPAPDEEHPIQWKSYADEIKCFKIPSGIKKLGLNVIYGSSVEKIEIPYDIELDYDPGWYDEEPSVDVFEGCYKDKVRIEITGTEDVLSTQAAKDLAGWGYYIEGYGWSMSGVSYKYKYDWLDDQEHADDGMIIAEKKYTGKKIKLSPKLWGAGGTVLVKGKDYTLSYPDCVNIGTQFITAKGKGDYFGAIKIRFVIYPKSTSLTKVVPAKKAFTAKWLRQAKKMKTKHIKGYIVQYSQNKDFSWPYSTKYIKGYKKTSVNIKGLKSKKTYYVRVRTYYKDAKDEYRATWSKKMKVKTK